jgi:hypothetical protein
VVFHLSQTKVNDFHCNYISVTIKFQTRKQNRFKLGNETIKVTNKTVNTGTQKVSKLGNFLHSRISGKKILPANRRDRLNGFVKNLRFALHS